MTGLPASETRPRGTSRTTVVTVFTGWGISQLTSHSIVLPSLVKFAVSLPADFSWPPAQVKPSQVTVILLPFSVAFIPDCSLFTLHYVY